MWDVLSIFEKLVMIELVESFVEGDRMFLILDGDGNVTLSFGLNKLFKVYYDGGWDMLDTLVDLGGVGALLIIWWFVFEMLVGVNLFLVFYVFGNYIVRIINVLGTELQKVWYVGIMFNWKWGGSMVLMEFDVGSDVGAGCTKVCYIEGDVWEFNGVKCFIMNVDYDFVENIVYFVLVCFEGYQLGMWGLFLFIVFKFWVEEDGSLGEWNGVFVINVEKKMGFKVFCICEFIFGDRMLCCGLLVGEVYSGICQMFMVIEYVCMVVGIKLMFIFFIVYLNVFDYCKEWVQGLDLVKVVDKMLLCVWIVEYLDVWRMFMYQKFYVEGLCVLVMYIVVIQDDIEVGGGYGVLVQLDCYNDFFFLLVKGYSSY